MKTQGHSLQNLLIIHMKSEFPKNNGNNSKDLNITGIAVWDRLFSVYAKSSQKIKISYPLIHTRTCANHGIRNV